MENGMRHSQCSRWSNWITWRLIHQHGMTWLPWSACPPADYKKTNLSNPLRSISSIKRQGIPLPLRAWHPSGSSSPTFTTGRHVHLSHSGAWHRRWGRANFWHSSVFPPAFTKNLDVWAWSTMVMMITINHMTRHYHCHWYWSNDHKMSLSYGVNRHLFVLKAGRLPLLSREASVSCRWILRQFFVMCWLY